jgi:hypothetical protein
MTEELKEIGLNVGHLRVGRPLSAALSEHAHIEHEPFNLGRMLGHVFRDFKASGDEAQLRLDLTEYLTTRPLIKHCYELCLHQFNNALMEVTTALGYRHIILDRRSETDRILSLELAKITGAWGGEGAKRIYPDIETGHKALPEINAEKVIAEMLLCRERRTQLLKMTIHSTPAPFVVYFEDVYSEPIAGRALVERLIAFLEINPAAHANYNTLVEHALRLRGQNTARVMDAVPNLEAIKTEMLHRDGAVSRMFTPS